MDKKLAKIVWNIDLGAMLDQVVDLETKEGFTRHARLTSIRFGKVELDGITVEYPTEAVLEGDDPIPFEQIKTMKRA